ncbi:MAG: EF-hand domain-containing protein [Alphaproteobacteria bacterium]|nr:EF-hand domain-containing protein [Alphaproteobacteria bacterium]
MALSNKKLSLLVASGLIGVALGGTAVLANGSMGPRFMGWHDGPHKMPGERMEQMITEMDTNNDGSITKAEAQAFRDAKFAAADANGDGAITPKEMGDAVQVMRFNHLDKNGDGAITQEEFLTANKGIGRGFKHFSRMDQDGSGRIEAPEMAEMTDHMFDRMDRNNDGTISAEELQPMHK